MIYYFIGLSEVNVVFPIKCLALWNVNNDHWQNTLLWNYILLSSLLSFPSGSDGKVSACNTGDPGSIHPWEDLEKEMVTHASIPAWTIPGTEEPGRLQSMGSQRVGHDWVTSLHFTTSLLICVIFLEIYMTTFWPESKTAFLVLGCQTQDILVLGCHTQTQVV